MSNYENAIDILAQQVVEANVECAKGMRNDGEDISDLSDYGVDAETVKVILQGIYEDVAVKVKEKQKNMSI